MLVYLINIVLILVWGSLLIYSNPTQQKKKIFCIIASLQWILISGLRGLTVGDDTEAYGYAFARAGNMSWREIWQEFIGLYFQKSETKTKDAGYLIFQKLIHIFTANYRIYLIIVAIIIFAALGWFIYKNAKDACFSYILFSCLFYSFYAITGIRQALATALIVFIGTEFIKNRRLIPFLAIAFVAYILHKSALVFVPFYFLGNKKITKTYLITLFTFTLVLLVLGSNNLLRIAALFGYEHEETFILLPTTYIALMLLIGAGTLVLLPTLKKKSDYNNVETNGILLAVALTVLTILDQGMMRVQQYYALYMMFAIPSMINCFNQKSGWSVKMVCVVILILLLARNNPQYVFYWQ